ncbi:MAG: NUDIX hydrolase [Oscillospiraceae bacterium]|jgi:ADP-ribose pyrophosphatase YjhB (NUDIX family)|nr:NUDIX hydrolase [Oscillospiraceae bacterium]
MTDISYSTGNYIFSYRAAGILVRDGKVLLQKPVGADGYAVPGGQVAFGESHEQTIKREFKEETGADVDVGELKWVEENIFPFDGKTAQQICLNYVVTLTDDKQIPLEGKFPSKEVGEHPLGETIEFHWLPLAEVKNLNVYPENAAELLKRLDSGVQHLIYRED